jgi:hypothetical protein
MRKRTLAFLLCISLLLSFYSYATLYNAYPELSPYSDMEDMYGFYHNSIPTLQEKVQWAKEYGLGGMMIWEISQDTTEESVSLLRAIYNSVNQ